MNILNIIDIMFIVILIFVVLISIYAGYCIGLFFIYLFEKISNYFQDRFK